MMINNIRIPPVTPTISVPGMFDSSLELSSMKEPEVIILIDSHIVYYTGIV